ncbi:hypothetical protein J6590_018597 [Homalodisca vitripennis]|nr:hypothetical protein J6590_018597 [Homalodisca vitripennis]
MAPFLTLPPRQTSRQQQILQLRPEPKRELQTEVAEMGYFNLTALAAKYLQLPLSRVDCGRADDCLGMARIGLSRYVWRFRSPERRIDATSITIPVLFSVFNIMFESTRKVTFSQIFIA